MSTETAGAERKLTCGEIEDILLLVDTHIEGDDLRREFCLIDDQDEDMMDNLKSIRRKLTAELEALNGH